MAREWQLVSGILIAGLALPASASIFNSCDGADDRAKPGWVSQSEYNQQGYYSAIGIADRSGKTLTQRRQQSEADAKQHLVEQIEVTIRSENKQRKDVSNRGVQQSASTEVSVTAEEILRGVEVRDQWLDEDSCTLYTLAVVSRDSVAQTRKEKRSRQHYNQMKTLLADGMNREINRDPQNRKTALEQAKLEFDGIDFASINVAYERDTYGKRIAEALSALNREIEDANSRIAAKAFNPDGKLSAAVLGKIIDQLNSPRRKVELLLDDCQDIGECRSKAKARGYGQLITLKIDTRTETSAMGALKGSMTIAETVYDVAQDKLIKAQPASSAQVIGWDIEELNWDLAAAKIMQDLK